MRSFIIFLFLALGAAPAIAQTMVHIGSASNGAELYVDRDTMRTNRPVAGMRPFEAIQIWATYDLQGVRRDPARQEKALYSFDCARRMSNTLAYQRYRANGARLHDWKAADLDFKYEPVKPGTLTEQAMFFVCNGGRLPQPAVQQDMGALVRVDGDEDEEDNVATPSRKP